MIPHEPWPGVPILNASLEDGTMYSLMIELFHGNLKGACCSCPSRALEYQTLLYPLRSWYNEVKVGPIDAPVAMYRRSIELAWAKRRKLTAALLSFLER